MEQLIMRGNKVVMPEKLWNQTIKLAHEGHQGMVRTKSRLREKVWWPNLDKQVEKLITANGPPFASREFEGFLEYLAILASQ